MIAIVLTSAIGFSLKAESLEEQAVLAARGVIGAGSKQVEDEN